MKYRFAWMMAAGLAVTVGAACEAQPDAARGTAEAVEQPAGTAGTDGAAAEAGVVYVDVRTPEEYAAGHVEGAILIPHTEMGQRHGELERYRDREIVVYCRSGRRSGIAKGILEEAGFENVTNGGGLRDLQARGVPTTR